VRTRGGADAGAAPPREAHFLGGDAATLVGLTLFALHPVAALWPVIAVSGAALICASLLRVPGFSVAPSALVGALCFYATAFSQWFVWPFYFLAPLTVMSIASAASGSLGHLLPNLKLGTIGWTDAGFGVAISVVAGLALVGWVWALEPDLAPFRSMIPDWSGGALLAAGLVFALLNAVLEEVIWRGILQGWLLRVAGAGVALLVQAVSFGAAHFIGFPGGLVGSALATLYGLMLGALALRSGGLLAPIVAHVAADVVIFTIVVQSAP